ncbi:MAG: ChaN family lipoprotein [bacterium]|nr:MAG: ChaN family lipoprotein [bacterium]
MLNRVLIIVIILVWCTVVLTEEGEFNTERLPIGNPKTKYNFCAVKLNKIFDTNANTEISLNQFIKKLSQYRIVLLGESHTNDQHHAMQLNIIKGLVESGSSICLALEMFNPSQNPVLEKYISGKLTEEDFLDQSNYFNSWGHNYRYYKPIFDYAKEHKIKMFGINIEHDYASKIGRGGIESLSPEEQNIIPEIDTTDMEHRFYIKAAMEGMDALSPTQFSKIYAAQCLWDAAMGEGAIKVAQQDPQSIVMIVVGSGHVAYNLGIGKIIKKRSDFSFSSVIAVDVPDTVEESVMMKVKKNLKKEKKTDQPVPKQEKGMPPIAMMHGGSVDTTPYKIVVRSLSDFLWGVAEEKREKYPSFGFSVEEKDERGFKVKRVIPETIAEEQGIQTGDIILAVDGKTFPDMAQLKKYLNFKNWDENVAFEILREEKEINIKFKIED